MSMAAIDRMNGELRHIFTSEPAHKPPAANLGAPDAYVPEAVPIGKVLMPACFCVGPDIFVNQDKLSCLESQDRIDADGTRTLHSISRKIGRCCIVRPSPSSIGTHNQNWLGIVILRRIAQRHIDRGIGACNRFRQIPSRCTIRFPEDCLAGTRSSKRNALVNLGEGVVQQERTSSQLYDLFCLAAIDGRLDTSRVLSPTWRKVGTNRCASGSWPEPVCLQE
jgi:hypothetical protein